MRYRRTAGQQAVRRRDFGPSGGIRRISGSDSRKTDVAGMRKYCMVAHTRIARDSAAFAKHMAYAHK